MTIRLALVARGDVVLAEQTVSAPEDSAQAIDHILTQQLQSSDTRTSYALGPVVYHCLRRNNLLYICASDVGDRTQGPFVFLEEVVSAFAPLEQNASTAPVFGLNRFARTLAQLMEGSPLNGGSGNGVGPSHTTTREINAELQQVKQIMLSNIDSVMERGENINTLVNMTEELVQDSAGFHRRTVVIRKNQWWKQKKLMAMGISAVVTVVTLIVVLAVFV